MHAAGKREMSSPTLNNISASAEARRTSSPGGLHFFRDIVADKRGPVAGFVRSCICVARASPNSHSRTTALLRADVGTESGGDRRDTTRGDGRRTAPPAGPSGRSQKEVDRKEAAEGPPLL